MLTLVEKIKVKYHHSQKSPFESRAVAQMVTINYFDGERA